MTAAPSLFLGGSVGMGGWGLSGVEWNGVEWSGVEWTGQIMCFRKDLTGSVRFGIYTSSCCAPHKAGQLVIYENQGLVR